MSALPHALRPWASTLSRFPLDVALHLGPMVARLSAVLGATRTPADATAGEPQGYDGLSRRGSFDRLLVSEWLWAMEAPDELVRRAAFGELSYLEPSFRQPRRAHRLVALFDAGPDQLGAPRIAHLALLIVLARRAEAAGATFSWGILQADPGRGCFSGVTPATVEAWLAARDTMPPSAERLEAWRQALALDTDGADAWLIGSPNLAGLQGAHALSRVAVSEVLAPSVRQLEVEVRLASRGRRSVLLDLPPPEDSVRLLKAPFQEGAVAPLARLRAPRLRGFTFSSDGRRLMLFHGDGGVSAMALPLTDLATVPTPQRVKPRQGEEFLGVGWRGRMGLFVLVRKAGTYAIRGRLRHWYNTRLPSGFPWKMRVTEAHPPALSRHQLPGRLTAYYDERSQLCLLLSGLDDNLYLFEEDPASRSLSFARVARGVSTVAIVRDDQCVPVMRTGPEGVGGGLALGSIQADTVHQVPLPDSEGGVVWFGAAGTPGHHVGGLLAVNQRPGLWHLHHQHAVQPVRLSPELRVVGVGVCHQAGGQAGVLALHADARRFWSVGPEHQVELAVAEARVVHAEASHAVPMLAWLTEDDELVLFHLDKGAVVYRFRGMGAG
ncbi:hypothetical protein [Myxococcus sp. Y35]|uniref:hypothetical protein n=1 Tax=Pseudomyxococcus flavus TaxID=3115648 RepID=UPI003CE77F4A